MENKKRRPGPEISGPKISGSKVSPRGRVIFGLCVLAAAFPLLFLRVFVYRPIEFPRSDLVVVRSTYSPAPRVLTWRKIPVEYELHRTSYVLHLARGQEHWPRIYLRAVSRTGQPLKLELHEIELRGSQPEYWFDWNPGDPKDLWIIVKDARGRRIEKQKLQIDLPLRGFLFVFDTL